MFASAAIAQTAAPASLEEVVVTASRVVRDGYQAPTPTTVVGAEDIAKAAPANIADYVNQLPSLAGSSSPRTGNTGTSNGLNGLNVLNLRSLGANRTLVLLDGRRVAPSTLTSAVDINNLPSALVERVEVVTGGASAAWGSDAVAGVVNFVLDSDFTGVKGSVQAGVTDRGDNEQWSANINFGKAFAGGRGHLLVSVEGAQNAGVDHLDRNERDWYAGAHYYTNPAYTATNGQPRQITRQNVNISNAAPGGVILTTALRGIQFGPGGTPQPFAFGTDTFDPFMVGGNPTTQDYQPSLEAALRRKALWGRLAFQVTDHVQATFEASYGESYSRGFAVTQRYYGNLTVQASNPFLPASIRQQAAALGITSFRYGTFNDDQGRPANDVTRNTARYVFALNGDLGEWSWDAYYQHGASKNHFELQNTNITANWNRAIDAVTDPTTGSIICRSTLTDRANGCVPLNIFGVFGQYSDAVRRYVIGTAVQDVELKQDVAAFSFNGEPFSVPAGPVSLAGGFEYRKESSRGSADALSLINAYQSGNFKATAGSYDVKEGFAEVVVPLLEGAPLAEKLEFNGAIRYTSYSTAGEVTTWKAGLSYSPIADVRFRLVRSRDIRAPNLSDLYLAGQVTTVFVNDPFQGGRQIQVKRTVTGNTGLVPEAADTTGFGVIYQPSWLSQLRASIDLYDINIEGSITTLGQQETLDRCQRGETSLCPFIIRDGTGTIVDVQGKPVNIAQERARGLDIELSFRQDLGDLFDGWDASLNLRALGTKISERSSTNNGVVTDSAGENSGSAPNWRWLGMATYDQGPLSLTATVRWISDGKLNNVWTEGVDIDENDIEGATYVDLAGTWRLGDGETRREVFFRVDNLLDKDPAVVPTNSPLNAGFNPTLYDVLGRAYRVGVRFAF